MAIYNRLTSEETELAQKIISIINKNISNPELDANQISNLMGISRSGLYLKTKNIFNVSIIELVREIRLTKAIQIMCEGNHSMAEIASKVGFLNQSYFTASFMHIPADTRSAFPVISVQSPVSIQCCWQS